MLNYGIVADKYLVGYILWGTVFALPGFPNALTI